jgi:hypothetical protein
MYVVLLVAAVVATIALSVAAFAGSTGSDEPVRPAGVSTPVAQHDPCSFAGDRRMAC